MQLEAKQWLVSAPTVVPVALEFAKDMDSINFLLSLMIEERN